MFKKPCLTVFAPLLDHHQESLETKAMLEEVYGESYAMLPWHEVNYPESAELARIFGKQVGRTKTCEILDSFNPDQRKLHLIAGSNERHESTFYFVEYVASKLEDLVYVHIDLHPDASLIPLREIPPGSLEYIHEGHPDMSFTCGTFVHRIKQLPHVKNAIMLGYMPCIWNNYNPYVTYDRVYGPDGITEKADLERLFKGRNVYATIDADSQRGWIGFMFGGNMSYPILERNLAGIAEAGNLVATDMTGFCKRMTQFEYYKNEKPYGWDPDQFGITKRVFDLTRGVLNG